MSDANNAGTKKATECTLILTEGDSAKSLAVAGLSVIGRDNYGVFPLRGKLLNVRDAKHDQIMKNEEIQNIKKILGLQHNKDYKDTKDLRYGQIMIMTDQVSFIGDCLNRRFAHIFARITMGPISKVFSSTSSTISILRCSKSLNSLSSLSLQLSG